jgi:hypothetical protein
VASLEAQWKWPFHVAIEAWLERYMSVLLYTAGSPRLFISYDDYFQAPEEQVRRLAKFLGRPFPRQGSERYQRIFGTVREDLRNFRAPIDKVLEDTRLASGDKYFYLGLQSACEAPMGTDRIDLQVMSDQYRAALRARFRTLRVYFEAYAKQAEADIKSAEMAAEEAQAAATALKSELARRGDVTAEERMSALRADIRSTLAEGLTDLRRDLEAHADSLRAELLMDLPDHAENGHHSATSNGNGSHNGHTHP